MSRPRLNSNRRKLVQTKRKLTPPVFLKTHRIGLATFLVSIPRKHAQELAEQQVQDVDPRIYEVIDKFLKNIDPDESTVNKINFGQAEKEFISKNGESSQDLISLLKYKDVIPSALCSRCVYNKGCPFYVSNEVCHYLTEPFGLSRKIADCLSDIQTMMTALLARSNLFSEESFPRAKMIFLFFAYLYFRIFDDQKAKKVGAPANNRRRSRLKFSAHNEKKEVREDIHKRWQILKIPKQMHREYYPKT